MAYSFFNLCAWQAFSTISLQVFFGLALGLAPSASFSIHFFTQSLSSYCSTCQYHSNLFSCSTKMMSSNPSLSLNPLLGTLSCYSCTLMPHVQMTIFISARWSATPFSFLTGQVSLPCNILPVLCMQLLYNLQLTHTHTHTHFVWDYLVEPVPNQSGFYWSNGQWLPVASANLHLA